MDAGSGIVSVVTIVTDEYGVYNMTGLAFGSTVQLEAWREGTDRDGRQYTITAVATDKAGNASTATTTVMVPHDYEVIGPARLRVRRTGDGRNEGENDK